MQKKCIMIISMTCALALLAAGVAIANPFEVGHCEQPFKGGNHMIKKGKNIYDKIWRYR
jgi:hypothetical protein